MSRGGKRTGTPGKAYGNRTDLHVPVMAAPNQEYGAAGAQIAAQQAVPIMSANQPAPIAPGNAGAVQPGPSSSPTPAAASPVPSAPLPGLFDPSNRPGEPMMAGVNAGAGPGGNALTPMLAPSPTASTLALLNTLGDAVSPQVAYVRNYLATLQQNQMPH